MAEKYVYAQGFYAGIPCLMGQFTASHGIRPSSGTLYFQRDQSVPPYGDLAITGVDEYGQPAEIVFRTCFVDNVQATASGDPLLVVRILDRRWGWEFGVISGHYNIRPNASNEIINEKTPRQLAELCLNAMGETNASLGDFNPVARPLIEWELTNAAQALDELVNPFGYRVILGIDNRVHIERAGVGDITELQRFTWLEDTIGVDLPKRPDGLIAVAGRTLYDMDLYLEPIGKETTGEWKNIDKLSYRPASNFVVGYDKGGWSGVALSRVPNNLNYPSNATDKQKEEINQLVLKHIYRTYRICTRKPPHWMEDNIPNNPPYGEYFEIQGYRGDQVKELWQLLPLEKASYAEIVGIFNSGDVVSKDSNERNALRSMAGDYGNRTYKLAFEIDYDEGIVHFEHRAHCIIDKVKKPARITLRIASGIKDKNTREWKRYRLEHRFSPAISAGLMVLAHDEVQLRYYIDRTKPLNPPTNNKKEVDQELRYYLNATAATFEQRVARSGMFAGIIPIAPTGLVQQVTWNFGSGPTTQFSANTEHSYNVPTYKERRFLARLQEDKRTNSKRLSLTQGAPK